MIDEALDLFLGSSCVGCSRPGRMLCARCRGELPSRAEQAWPTPTPEGLVTPWATASYDGAVRELVVGHKDRGQWSHRRALGGLLAAAVGAAAADLDPAVPLLLVPAPSRRGAGRRRGYEPTAAIVGAAARLLRTGRPVGVADLLLSRGPVEDQAGLGAQQRGDNVRGSMHCPSPALARVRRRWPVAHLLVCDDVVTTGATAREAQRALEAVGLGPVAIAAVAATRRRVGLGPGPLRG
ncbi:MAG: ComF family protein [Nocardioides sp.]|nr:ComF family protein [Nocardioides sp.]